MHTDVCTHTPAPVMPLHTPMRAHMHTHACTHKHAHTHTRTICRIFLTADLAKADLASALAVEEALAKADIAAEALAKAEMPQRKKRKRSG